MKYILMIAVFCACLLACGGPGPETGSASVAGSGGSGNGGAGGLGGAGGEEPSIPSCASEEWTDGAWICSVCACAGQACYYRPFMGGELTMGQCGEDLKCSAECPSKLTPP